MSYSYEIIENGYIIEGNGTRIKQTNVAPFKFPHPGDTIEESAQNHINALKQDNTPAPPSEIEQLRIEMAQANTELFEMMMLMTGGGMS